MQSMYIQLGNPKDTPVRLSNEQVQGNHSNRMTKARNDLTTSGNPPYEARPTKRLWVSPHKFGPWTFPSQKQPLEWPEKHFGERFAHLSCKTVLSFTVNCNSSPYYVFGTFQLATTVPTVQSLIDTGGTNATRASLYCYN